MRSRGEETTEERFLLPHYKTFQAKARITDQCAYGRKRYYGGSLGFQLCTGSVPGSRSVIGVIRICPRVWPFRTYFICCLCRNIISSLLAWFNFNLF
jgi:hypothetical protein